jgi:putative metallohydrolase (TIGR04338 family)
MRDYQRSKVYAWESAVIDPVYEGAPMSLETCQAYSNVVMNEMFPHHSKVRVVDGRGCGRALAYYGRGKIALPRHTRHKHVILHELAHIIAGSSARHGPRWVKLYIKMLSKVLGANSMMLHMAATDMGVDS